MGKQARKKRQQDPIGRLRSDAERAARSYLSGLAINHRMTAPQFWAQLEQSLGKRFADDFEAAIERREQDESDAAVYDLMYRDVETVKRTAPILNPMAFDWLTHFAAAKVPEGDIVDLGSGAGLLTCFYAMRRPASQVVGIELNAAGVDRGRELAREMGLTNVAFEQGDLRDVDLGRRFDCAVSTLALTEVDFSRSTDQESFDFSTLARGRRRFESETSDLAGVASRHLTDEGAYLSFERLPRFDDFAGWVGAQQRHGLGIELGSAGRIVWQDPMVGRQSSQALVARPSARACALTQLEDWYLSEIPTEEFECEVRLNRSQEIAFHAGTHLEVSDQFGSGATRIYRLQDRSDEVIYLTTSRGFRQEIARVSASSGGLRDDFEAMIDNFTQDPEVTSSRPLEENDLLQDLDRT
ncbi:class I SAM-dependent methyltransferase [Ilumatobacter coccineus]|uniref:Methyltransferase domain-containing protein n=1 Tax=Ilumatobacter coccineus (strain NBRC 103263 / KCTC 29153 / YM16-304) TaxID=1313172 RepID=A0A6C7EDL0_ILUCY|nr:class I SAM-dependent methyltransferase [Ilumatobacter coccineus]BAN04403.1 hypothetical protein YM304_40890 [Ilumatobacter coccineus YM16-304]